MSSALNAQAKKKSSPAKPKATGKPKSVKASTHPPFADIIRACIAETGDRTGVSRATIKRFIEDRYKMEVTPAVVSNINRSITYGAEKGTFVLPKGPSGKVKLAPKKSSSDAAKENAKPTKVTSTKKPVTAKPAAAKPTTKQASKPAKKVTTVKKATKPPAKRVTSKKPSAKTVLTGSGKAKPTSPKVKTAVKKKVTAAPASKKAKTTKAKPASTKAASAAKPASKK